MESSKMDITRRRGVVKISRDVLDKYIAEYDTSNPVFSEFVPYNVEYDYVTNSMLIYGFSRHFREVKQWENAPEYVATVENRIVATTEVQVKFTES